ncbi:MAG: flagellar export chaperone FliS [Nitrospinae bacterium]|nr:flagellar export chaperone FliS [Nitrospinota bacterium]
MQGYGRPSVYQVTQVSTANKSKLVLMMYDGAIRFINDAKRCLETRDIAGRGLAISKAQRIVHELRAALNMEKGGEVAVSLEKVYSIVNRRLLDANMKGSVADLNICMDMFTTLKDAWSQAMHSAGQEQMPIHAAPMAAAGVKVAV